MDTKPLETRCDNCAQSRPVFLYEPNCGIHLGAGGFTCPWCAIDRQPLLCTPCWSARKEREEADPALNSEAEVMERICAANRRYAKKRDADRAVCEGIAKATEERSS
ncbi:MULTISPECIES: hypothetical protein [Actinomycetes]|uniref:Uncharacterized protein n=1 Tax=Luedemannella helvata TaxID=349315 RepID=A0ABP4XLF3_9ACTN|nr:hypothetical protein [Streptomyces virginiae]